MTMTPQGNSVLPMGLCLENYNYTYPVSYITLNIQRRVLKMAFMDVQPEHPNGQTIMLLHGKNFCGAYWGQTAKVLAGKGYRVIVPDQIGFGKSSKPDMLQYTFQLLASATKAVLDSAGVGKVIVLGHSMGGMVATRFVLLYPERVEKFILEDPIGLEDWQLKVPYQGVDAWFDQELKQNSLEAAHLAVNDSGDAAAFAKLEAGNVTLFGTEDFIEGRKAEAENRAPVFHGR
jgi:pimeloyl-ACP methyl ester carboxylesterase